MGIEPAQFDALVAEIGQHVHDLMEVVGRLVLIEDVGPAADGKSSLHEWVPRMGLAFETLPQHGVFNRIMGKRRAKLPLSFRTHREVGT